MVWAIIFIALAPRLAAASATTYHDDAARNGDYTMPGLTWRAAAALHPDPDFHAAIKGAVYAQPLYWHPPGAAHGLLIVATEADEVDALDADTGKTIWHRQLGKPVPLADRPCGDIDPLGITGTPVIDAATGMLYLDAVTEQNGTSQHLVFGLRLSDGATAPGWPVTVQAALGGHFDPQTQNQRGALALLAGRIFIPYGGNFGDCGSYHGIILGLQEKPPHDASSWTTRGEKGGIWAPGGISAADGSLFFTTGNTVAGPHWADGVAAFRLGPDLARGNSPQDYFAPGNWQSLDEEDLDLSGVAPLPFNLPGGAQRLLALGKDGDAYLLNRADLGGINGAIATSRVAHSPIITAPAAFPAGATETVIFPARNALCPDGKFSAGLTALSVSATAIKPLWCARLRSRGAPIVTTTDGKTDPIVWIDGVEGDDHLHGFRGDTGAPLYTSAETLPGVPRFVTPLAANGHLYIAGDGRIFAFSWPAR